MKYFVCLVFMPLVFVTLAAAAVTNEKIPLMFDDFIPCANDGAGEIVSLSGTLHVLTVVQENHNGGTLFMQHHQPQGVIGLGITTGDVYQGTGVTQETEWEAAPSAPFTATEVDNYRLIGPGPGNDLLIHEVFHVTVNAEGEVSTELDHLSEECK